MLEVPRSGCPTLGRRKEFYGSLLGWTFADQGEEFGHYSIAQVKGVNVGGISPPMEEGTPSVWTLYLASDDADKTAAAVKEHSGSVLFEPIDVGPLGRMFIGLDPAGAAFGVWQAKQHIGASIVNEPGALTWDDLRSTGPDAARAFYAEVFGFRSDALPDPFCP